MHYHDAGSSDGLWTAFEAEAMPHVDRLFRLAMWWERDRGEAEDLVQDALVQALQSFHRFTGGTMSMVLPAVLGPGLLLSAVAPHESLNLSLELGTVLMDAGIWVVTNPVITPPRQS
jgi:hypothetical protein